MRAADARIADDDGGPNQPPGGSRAKAAKGNTEGGGSSRRGGVRVDSGFGNAAEDLGVRRSLELEVSFFPFPFLLPCRSSSLSLSFSPSLLSTTYKTCLF